MPRRKIQRSPEEEEIHKRAKLDKKNETRRLNRLNKKNEKVKKDQQKSTGLKRTIEFNSYQEITRNAFNFQDEPSTSTQIHQSNININAHSDVSVYEHYLETIRNESLTPVETNQSNIININVDNDVTVQEQYLESSQDECSTSGEIQSNRSHIININNDVRIHEHYLGPIDVICANCKARHFTDEQVANKKYSFNDCCSHGEVQLDKLPEIPPFLKSLFDGSHNQSNHFFERIRYYNSSFSFASFNANLIDFNNRRPGPYCFKIQGQIYYQINESLYPAINESPSNGQLFIIDANESSNFRCQRNSQLDINIVKNIETMMRTHNIFAKSFQMMKDELIAETIKNNNSEPELQLLFSLKPGMDKRRFNFQRVNEVAAVFSTTADGDIPESFVTIRNKHDKQLKTVSTMDPNVEPWIYPLFYPYGTQGWHTNIKCKNKNKTVTRNAYTKYRMAIRDDFNTFIMGRRLFQQWVVDSYVKIEKDRINYCRNNQKKLRAESYQGLIDHLQKRNVNSTQQNGNDNNGRLGKVYILPSTFVNSPRNMIQHYQDAMCIVRKYGTPDLFITMTCNPRWREIEENLLPGQTASDRPDLVARVFYLKVKKLIHVIVKENHFGKVIAYVYVIEYQKRGLPHVHLLITLAYDSKIITPIKVDNYISAEIPNPKTDPILHEIVMKNMIHGPCGDWCLEDNKCSKKFPKTFVEETTMDENGYPHYQRRNTGEEYTKSNNYKVNNRYVVPYNKKLLLLFNCHVNSEIVSSIKAVKYLYKYIYKGHDAAAVSIINPENDRVIDHDEIQDFIEGRYVGPVEACWRILNKELQQKSHAVIRLPVHLQNQHTITVDSSESEESINKALEKQTMLIDYFNLNNRDLEARKFSYAEIPCHYVFKKTSNDSNAYSWEKRKKQMNVIGRMYSISPSQIELFHLRLLLIHRKGATSFDDLKMVNGTICNTFLETCLALGLIEDDDEWERAMNEAESWMMPQQLRRLFVRILIYCQPIHPELLWSKFKNSMSQDYQRSFELNLAYTKAYGQIYRMLIVEGSHLNQFPNMEQIIESNENDINDHLYEEHKTIGKQQYDKLNEKQKEIVDLIYDAVFNNTLNENPSCFFIDGPGGSGKTFIYTTLYHILKGEKKNVCTMALTGIAATLLPEGKTVHKAFGMPVPLYYDSSTNIKKNSKDYKYLKDVDLFIWDEAPMAPRHALELVDRTLRDILDNDKPFGGKTIVLGGDFRQLLPIKLHATRSEMVNLSIKFSSLWKYFTKFTLTQNMRTLPEEAEFAQFLLSIGNGTLNDNDNYVTIPHNLIAPANCNIVDDIYGDIIKRKNYDMLTKVAILSPRNLDVDDINDEVINLLDAVTERIYESIDSTEHCDNGELNASILTEYLHTINPPNFPPHNLRLRLYSVIMLVRNLSITEGLCNGTRLLIIELGVNLLKCKILTGDKAGDIVFVNRITLYFDHANAFTFKRRQFPVRLAFAMTINKAQGQTFENIGIDLHKDVFNHGQLYVAMSRVKSWSSLKVYLDNKRNDNRVKNHVYREIYETT